MRKRAFAAGETETVVKVGSTEVRCANRQTAKNGMIRTLGQKEGIFYVLLGVLDRNLFSQKNILLPTNEMCREELFSSLYKEHTLKILFASSNA